MKNILILNVLILLISQFHTFKSSDRIIGGNRARHNQFPFFAQLYMFLNDDDTVPSSCGATLIHKQWILSAGHCLSEATKFWVNIGTININSSYGNINKVVHAFVHPSYVLNSTSTGIVRQCSNDIAVAKLEREYEFSASIQPVHFPSRSLRCKTGTVVGIGLTVFFPEEIGDYVKYAIVRSKERKELWNPNIIPPSTTLFFSEVPIQHKRYIFKGDSGGPYLCYIKGVAVQYGIISQTDNDTVKATVQSAYESVYKHMDFILKYVPDVKIHKKKSNRKRSRPAKADKSTVARITSTVFVVILIKVLVKYGPI